MIRILDSSATDPIAAIGVRAAKRDREIEETVRAIIEDVRARGDLALLEMGRRFDSPSLESIKVSQNEIECATVPESQLIAIETAAQRIGRFHRAQIIALTEGLFEFGDGFGWVMPESESTFAPGTIGQRLLPAASAGIYVPGGGAPYASSVLMNAIPAFVAGVPRVVLTSPPSKNGKLAPAVLVAMRAAGVIEAFKMGGAGAIAAFAFGTESVPRVDTIAGPGNRFVNEAKRQVWGSVGLDGFAGPSEVCVLADDEANAAWAAADLLTQIEHATDNAAFLITTSRAKLDEILACVEQQLAGSARESTMREALRNESFAIVVRDLHEAAAVINAIAPEHVSIALKDPEAFLPNIRNAGCVLLGEWTPESGGDFAIGPSHTLPTSGAARFGSPVNVLNFLRVQSVAHLTQAQLEYLTPTIAAFGEMEGFPTHARGTTIRFD